MLVKEVNLIHIEAMLGYNAKLECATPELKLAMADRCADKRDDSLLATHAAYLSMAQVSFK